MSFMYFSTKDHAGSKPLLGSLYDSILTYLSLHRTKSFFLGRVSSCPTYP